ncbi:integral membrane protein DUF92-domain-containing protein [Cantharellus anzutake]|uniref:integral membrane protein DUF92-domain-containing protein n=1 Tax=Cantharellus anzutake TaxID=1750568 RepID=UPI0019060C95|nr:integral membrane protein DUF92-domain-containing protein [Cantharellus anzutake]KAF8332329.1 integral membrane protein DUF92-domain-containing protein [Cantharellus anzutake]
MELGPFPIQSLVIPFLLATYLSVNGYRKGSLSSSGAVAGLIVGFIIMSAPLRVFGVTLIAFYLVASKATKYGQERKIILEEGHQVGGNRTAWQVLSNSFTATIIVCLWSNLFISGSLHARLMSPFTERYLGPPSLHTQISWCPLAYRREMSRSRALLLAYLGHMACCLGDTLASEIGVLAKSTPRLVTTWKKVPPGTNGGMTLLGTFASVLGGALIGAILGFELFLEGGTCLSAHDWKYSKLFEYGRLVLYGAVAGALGSYIDSLLGATLQKTRYHKDKKQILLDESLTRGPEVTDISGLNVLNNNQVNFISATMTAAIFGGLSFQGLI